MKVSRYSYKYLPDSSFVYVVTKQSRNTVKQPLFSRHQCFLTQHLELKARKENRHVVVGFANEMMLQYRLPELIEKMHHDEQHQEMEMIPDEDPELQVHVTQLKHIKTHCALMTMPLIVYMNSYCDLREDLINYDVYFHEDRGPYRSTSILTQ